MECCFVYDGKDGIEMMKKHCFDIVFTDLQMPGVDDIEVLKYLKQYEECEGKRNINEWKSHFRAGETIFSS